MNEPKKKKIAAQLARLEQDGRLTPNAVLEEARNPNSPLHSEFEWDDSKAAERYRLSQARKLIRSVKFEVTYESHTLAAPYYVRDTEEPADQQGYSSVVRLQSDDELARDTLAKELDRALTHMARVEALAEALGLSSEYKRAVGAVQRLRAETIEHRAPERA